MLISMSSNAELPDRMLWLEDAKVRVGLNLDLGGAITWVGPAGSEENLVNNHDWGRQIQMSFYSGPVPFAPNGKKPKEHWAGLGWNPIQSGDCYNNRSQVLQVDEADGEAHVVCRPMQWPLDGEPGDCTFESWVRVEQGRVRVRGRLNNAREDTTWYEARSQELPAVYTNGVYYRLMTYTGDAPFTGGALERITQRTEPGFPWKFWHATEHWAALVNDEGWGLGVIMPGSTHFVGGFSGKENEGGTKDAPTGYIAPLREEVLDHNIVYDFEYVLTLGTLDEIRRVAEEEAKPSRPPLWRFERDRQGWSFKNARDQGWPVEGALEVRADGSIPRLLSPVTFWRAEDAGKLVITLEDAREESSLRVCWRRHAQAQFDEDNEIWVAIGGGEGATSHTVDLARAPGYAGGMLQLRLTLPDGMEKLRIRAIELLP